MKKLKTLFLILPLLLCQCDLLKIGDSDPELPPITTTGEDTFGALVNGKVWLPSNSINQGAIFQKDDLILIFADKEINDIDENFSIVIFDEVIAVGEYLFDKKTSPNRVAEWQNDASGCLYLKDDISVQYSGQLNISHLDRVKRIISGTFSFVLSKPDCPTINIDQGRFDLPYTN